MRTVFADSHYFFALVNPHDDGHSRAVDFSKSYTGGIVSTAWVFTELGDGLASPQDRPVFNRLLARFVHDSACRLIAPSRDLFDAGAQLFADRQDKNWSLTDCISFTVMRELGLTDALTGDRHFVQAGYCALLI